MARRFFSLLISFSLLFQQVGFASIATELNLAGHLAKMSNAFTPDRFRPAHIRFFSYDALNDNIKIMLDKGDAKGLQINESTQELLNYFLVGINLPNDKFWVNLRPDSEDNIIDDYLAKTDVGKIMLEADLQLKRDTAQFTSPQTPEGREYWEKLYKKAEELYGYDEVTIPTLTRPWIVPNEIIVRQTKDSAYIYKATLKVMLEQDYLKDSTSTLTSAYSFKDARSKALNEYSSRLIRELIIPKLTKEVNLSKRYAPLRQVYYSIILSRWFKSQFNGQAGKYASRIDRKDLSGLTSAAAWSKATYFEAYKKSFAKGEYNVKKTVRTPTGQVIRSYFSGGMDLKVMAINGGTAASPIATALTKAGLVSPEGSSSIPTVSVKQASSAVEQTLKIVVTEDIQPNSNRHDAFSYLYIDPQDAKGLFDSLRDKVINMPVNTFDSYFVLTSFTTPSGSSKTPVVIPLAFVAYSKENHFTGYEYLKILPLSSNSEYANSLLREWCDVMPALTGKGINVASFKLIDGFVASWKDLQVGASIQRKSFVSPVTELRSDRYPYLSGSIKIVVEKKSPPAASPADKRSSSAVVRDSVNKISFLLETLAKMGDITFFSLSGVVTIKYKVKRSKRGKIDTHSVIREVISLVTKLSSKISQQQNRQEIVFAQGTSVENIREELKSVYGISESDSDVLPINKKLVRARLYELLPVLAGIAQRTEFFLSKGMGLVVPIVDLPYSDLHIDIIPLLMAISAQKNNEPWILKIPKGSTKEEIEKMLTRETGLSSEASPADKRSSSAVQQTLRVTVTEDEVTYSTIHDAFSYLYIDPKDAQEFIDSLRDRGISIPAVNFNTYFILVSFTKPADLNDSPSIIPLAFVAYSKNAMSEDIMFLSLSPSNETANLILEEWINRSNAQPALTGKSLSFVRLVLKDNLSVSWKDLAVFPPKQYKRFVSPVTGFETNNHPYLSGSIKIAIENKNTVSSPADKQSSPSTSLRTGGEQAQARRTTSSAVGDKTAEAFKQLIRYAETINEAIGSILKRPMTDFNINFTENKQQSLRRIITDMNGALSSNDSEKMRSTIEALMLAVSDLTGYINKLKDSRTLAAIPDARKSIARIENALGMINFIIQENSFVDSVASPAKASSAVKNEKPVRWEMKGIKAVFDSLPSKTWLQENGWIKDETGRLRYINHPSQKIKMSLDEESGDWSIDLDAMPRQGFIKLIWSDSRLRVEIEEGTKWLKLSSDPFVTLIQDTTRENEIITIVLTDTAMSEFYNLGIRDIDDSGSQLRRRIISESQWKQEQSASSAVMVVPESGELNPGTYTWVGLPGYTIIIKEDGKDHKPIVTLVKATGRDDFTLSFTFDDSASKYVAAILEELDIRGRRASTNEIAKNEFMLHFNKGNINRNMVSDLKITNNVQTSSAVKLKEGYWYPFHGKFQGWEIVINQIFEDGRIELMLIEPETTKGKAYSKNVIFRNEGDLQAFVRELSACELGAHQFDKPLSPRVFIDFFRNAENFAKRQSQASSASSAVGTKNEEQRYPVDHTDFKPTYGQKPGEYRSEDTKDYIDPLSAYGEASSSPSIPNKRTGGIDFRPDVMMINYQPMGNFVGLNPKLPVLSKAELANFDIDKELSAMEKMVEQGQIVPSGQRVKETLAALSAKGKLGANKERLMVLLVKIGILEETQCYLQDASNEYKEALVLADSLA